MLVLTASLDEDPARERELARRLIDRRVDGLIVMPAGRDARYVVAEQQAGTHVVFVDRAPLPLLADAVVSDNRGGAAAAVAHLLATGRRRVAYLGDEETIPTAQERHLGGLRRPRCARWVTIPLAEAPTTGRLQAPAVVPRP